MIRGVRGATTVNENNEMEIIEATEILLRKMIEENSIDAETVASVFISVTEDITAVFPARAMRLIDGWKYVPVMCMREIPVESSLERCIRVMMHVNTNISQQDISHIYLGNAIKLRPDLNTADKF
ncbi:chorismate mutase [Bacillus sp. DTU_2020_1000418_1_SI_GHA_SEK_038]|uniref:chorismate mutase n=1 Tax=Bacillus sp. DTU_2020_1000418_1_SI_GHA_SEK_038 TaxID=3077585 RepID=UPI0028E5D983|nr:chorismate mutase [Bacillus sp. DTU_2020_1000418_1_SI_GHA_SEK_038]WNS74028.1 chorismate mutase [Bacillus sp. DTU_2020_1000418_1_SI_GHA_SEK_038]